MDVIERFKAISQKRGQESADILKRAVFSNIQNLFHTRSSLGVEEYCSDDVELDNLSFGLPDFTGLSLRSPRDIQMIIKTIKKSLIAYEPRLQNVSVSYVDRKEKFVFFRVQASLNLSGQSFMVHLDLSRWSMDLNE